MFAVPAALNAAWILDNESFNRVKAANLIKMLHTWKVTVHHQRRNIHSRKLNFLNLNLNH
jgi:hypothetical protein